MFPKEIYQSLGDFSSRVPLGGSLVVVDRRGRLVVHVYLLCGSADGWEGGQSTPKPMEPKFDGVVG